MKPLFFLLLLLVANNLLLAQDLPVVPVKPKPTATKPPTTASPKSKSKTASTSTTVSNAPVAGTQTVKFISDAAGDLYIDGEKRGRLQPNTVLRVNLRKGNYLIKVIGTGNKADELNEKYTVAETGNEFLYQINLQAVINIRLQQERKRDEARKMEEERQKELARLKELEKEYLKSITTVTIGTQVWMQQNLNVDHFRNGDPIWEARSAEQWKRFSEQGKPCWCYYDNNAGNGKIYGKLYNWYAVTDPRGLAPTGWHIPKDEEWTSLEQYLGYSDAGNKMKSTSGWNNTGNGNNSSGFSGLSGGMRGIDGAFYNKGFWGFWWTSSDANLSNAWTRRLDHDKVILLKLNDPKTNGFSVRCVRN
jgi:uncharacterized protein (TIGR02145 family)